MKKILPCVLLILICCSLVLYGCKDKNNDINNDDPGLDMSAWPEMPPNTNPNFKYFGYYHFSDAIDEVADMGNANLAKVDIELVDEIAHLAARNFNILIMIRGVFFEGGETPADWETRWEAGKAGIEPYLDNIIGFYVDEPMWTGKSKAAFHFACQTVRADYPDKKMMAMLMYDAVLQTGLMVKEEDPRDYCKYCTDIGFDFYRSWNKKSVLYDIALLKKNVLIDGQMIWLSPKGFYTLDPEKNINFMFENEKLPPGDDIINWIKGCYEIAVEDHRIVGFLTFVYGDDQTFEKYDYYLSKFFDPESPSYRKDVRDIYIQIGKAVIANDI